jgi:redox-sensitive bicupin YhaK (pirin superfamily)
MIIHRADTRGLAEHGWLKSFHTFSFAEYYDPERMGFGALRVINDDSVSPGMGFGRHPHRDMEIISIPLEGGLEHTDSEGNHRVIQTGEVQVMSAGTGIFHSEFNHSKERPVKFLQIWVLPKKIGISPRYEQKRFPLEERRENFQLVVSPDGRGGSLAINQDAFFSLTHLSVGREVSYKKYLPGNGIYLFVISGEVELDGKLFGPRDGAAVKENEELLIKATSEAEVLLMEVPFVGK